MPPITRSMSKTFECQGTEEKDRDKMLEAAYILLTLSRGN